MNTGTVWGITLLLAGALATLTAAQLLCAALFPDRTAAAARTLERRPVASLALGLAGFVPALALTVALLKLGKGLGPAIGGTLALGLLLAGPWALSVTSRFVGTRMRSEGAGAERWRQTLRGAVTIGLASLLPFAGLLVVLPLSISAGFGALALSFFAARAPAEGPPAVVEPAGSAA